MRQRVRLDGLAMLAFTLAAVAPPAAQAQTAEDPALRRGRIYFNTGKYSKAIGELRTALRRNNRSADAHLWLGKAYARSSEFDKAIEHVKQAVELRPGNEEGYRELGAAFLEVADRRRGGGQHEAAKESVQKAADAGKTLIKLKPKQKESYEFLIRLAKSQKQLDTALAYAEKVLEIDPTDISTHLDRIDVLLGLNRIEEAEKRCHEVLKINPLLRQPKLILARIHQAKGDNKGAIKILTDLIAEKKAEVRAYLHRAEIYLAEQRYEEALADANEALRLTNRNPFANFIRGSVYMRLKKLDDAIHEYQQAAAGLPTHLPSHFWLARCYLMKDKLREAIEELNTVVKINARFTPARLVLASAHLQQGYPDGAINVLLDALHYDPNNVEVRRLLGVAYLHKGEHDKARQQFQKMAEQDPDAPRAQQILAGIALAEGDIDKAVQHCLKALDVEPKNVDVHFLLGLAYLRRDRLDGAKSQFERVLELRGRHPGARMNLAAVHLRLREFDLAQEQYQRCIEEDPTLSKPRYNLARLYILQRKFDKAESELNQLLKIEGEKAKVHLALAELHRAKGEKEKAANAAKTALTIDKKLLAARVFMARLDIADQNWPAALEQLTAALKEDPKYAPGYEAAVIQVYLGRYDQAVKLFEQAVTNDLQRARSFAAAAAALQLKGDQRAALAMISQADKEKAENPLVALQTANIYLTQGEVANARTLIKQAHYVPKPIREAYLALIDKFAADKAKGKAVAEALTRVIFYGSRGWHTEAEQNCNLLLKLAPKNTFAYTVLANTYRAMGQPQKEIQTVQRLIDVDPADPKHRLRLGGLYVRVGRFKEARTQLEKAVEVAPADADARLALAAYFLRMALYDQCIEQTQKVLEADKQNAQALGLLAQCYLTDKKLDEAKEILKRLTKVKGETPRTLPRIQLARIAQLEGKTDQAIDLYTKAVKEDPESVQARMGLGHALRAKGKIAEAIEQFKNVLSIDSTNSPALLALAQIYRASRRLDLALDTCERAAKISPSSQPIRFELAAIHLARGRHDDAIAEYKHVLKLRANDLRAKIGIAEALFQSGNHAAAIQQITDLMKQQQQQPLPPAQAALVAFYKRLGEIDKAQEQLESLVRATPQLLGAYDLAVLYIHKDKLDAALRLIGEAEKQPSGPALTLAKGTALQLKGQIPQAIAAFTQARKANPDNPRLASLLANAHLAAGQPDKAREAIKSVTVQPALLTAYLELIDKLKAGGEKARLTANALNQAALYADANWLTLARERYERLLKSLPNNLAVLHLLADVYERVRDADNAIATYQRMLAAKPGYGPALRNLARHHLATNHPELAAKVFRQLLKAKPDSIDLKLALATTIQRQKKIDEAIALYKELINKAPAHPIPYNNLAWIYASEPKHKDIKQAEAFATKALGLTTPDTQAGAAIRDTLAWVCYLKAETAQKADERQQLLEKAMDLAQEAAAGMPGSAEIRYHLGMIYFRRNHRASAARHLTQTLKIDPEFEQKEMVNATLDRIRRGVP